MPVHHLDTRPFSFPPGQEALFVRRQDSLQEREHAGKIYSNAYVGVVYHNLPPPRRKAQLELIASPLLHEVRDSRPHSSALHEQHPPCPAASYTPPELPAGLRIRVPAAAHQYSTPRIRKASPTPPHEVQAHRNPSDEYETVMLRHSRRKCRDRGNLEENVPQLPHASQADPLQRQQHATDTRLLTGFATAYHEHLSRPRLPIHGFQVARKPLPANANVPARFMVDPNPLARQARQDSVRNGFRRLVLGATMIYRSGPKNWK
jgi:hypothetical protein